MKKRILSLFLALLMVSGLALPALADVFALVETSPDPEQKQAAESAPPMTAQTEDGLVVEVVLGEDVTNIPEGSHVDVAPLSEVESEEYEKLGAAVLNGKVAQSRFVDITILDPDGQSVEPNGKVKVSLNAPDAAPEGSTMHVVHFKDPAASAPSENEENDLNAELPIEEKAEPQPEPKKGLLSKSGLRAESITLDKEENGIASLVRGDAVSDGVTIPSDDPVVTDGEEQLSEEENEFIIEEITDYQVTEEGTILFETDSFSVFGIIYTVDFHWNVEGQSFEYSIPGGGFISLTELLTILQVADDIPAFVAEIENVAFSNPELVWIGKTDEETTVGSIKAANELNCQYSEELSPEQIEEIDAQVVNSGDWALISLRPFTSEEELTVTMKDGEVFKIQVTDAQIKKTVIDAKGDTWEITVTYGEDAQIPDGAELKVREIFPEDRKYEQYYQQSLKKTREGIDTEVSSDNFGYAHIFDIEILDQGQKIEPEANVSVTIKLLDTPQEIAALRVVHFSTDGPEIIDIEGKKEETVGAEISFVTDEFSVYAVIEDVNHGETDLANRTVKISVGGNYLTNQTNYGSPWRIGKTNNINQAADYQFEATGTPGVYRVYTMVNGQKNYMHINRVNDNSGNVNLTSDYTMDLHVVQNTDGTYGIYRNDGGTNYYLNQYGGAGGTGFAAYADADGGGNSKLTFTSVPAAPNALKAGTHIMLAKIDEYYYIVNNDGSLTSVEYIGATNQVKVENPMMWTYTGSNLYHNSDAVDFDGSMIASDYYYKYIDPSTGIGISEDNDDNTTTEIAGYKDTDNNGTYETPYYRIVNGSRQMQPQSALTYTNRHLKSSNGDYYIGVTEENGVLKLAGRRDSDHAVEILFASPTAVLPVDSSNHTVSHIDVSIEGTSEVDVPLAYGKYYDANRNMILEVSSNKSIKLTKEGIGISTDDMKKASIIAYTKTESGQAVPIDNAFYVTGYSANSATEYSTPQVRIEGSFKVANLPVTDQDWGHRLNNKIYYSVTAVKTVTFDLVDPALGQLYDADGNKLSITIDVAFSASFDYWDERNECPPVKWDPYNWPRGNIPGGSGMDFVLGGDAEQAGLNIVAIEISKLVVDENGNRIKPSTSTPVNNSFEIWQDADGNPNSVIGMGIDGKPINVNYGDYVNLHSKNIKVGVDGIGLVYDYDVTPGMYYIREDPNSVRDDIVDTDGNHWEYAGTRIETESPWRDDSVNDGKYHVSGIYTKDGGTYNAVPEVLGNYSDINGNTTWIDHDDGDKVKPVRNGFLEFYVYNIYKPVADLKLRKIVTIDGLSPTNSAITDKTLSDGDYTFTIVGVTGTATEGYSATVVIKITEGAAVSAHYAGGPNLTLDDDGFVTLTDMVLGPYMITEEEHANTVCTEILFNGPGEDTSHDLTERKIEFTLAAGNDPTKVTYTNNRSETETDIAHVSIRKTFVGLTPDQLPDDFEIDVKINGVTYKLTKDPITVNPPDGNGVTFDSHGSNSLIWDWRITLAGLTGDTPITIEELTSTCDVTGYTLTTTTINGTTTTVNSQTTISATGTVDPRVVIEAISTDTITANNKLDFDVYDSQTGAKIFLARLTDHQDILVISLKKLNLSERTKLEAVLPDMDTGNWTMGTVHYYSFEEAANGRIMVRGRTVTYNETTGKIHFSEKCQWNMVGSATITYQPGRPADFNLTNKYTEIPVDIDVIKIEKDSNPVKKLAGAEFTLKKIDPGTTIISYLTTDFTTRKETTVLPDAKISFSGLTSGYYEISETNPPPGYVLTEPVMIYFKIETGGIVTYLKKQDGVKPSSWNENVNWNPTNGTITYTPAHSATETTSATNTTFTVGNTPGAELPSTGGSSRTLSIIGTTALMIAGAGYMLATHKKKEY